jgi:GNAT superfamily N-acetyltransferase
MLHANGPAIATLGDRHAMSSDIAIAEWTPAEADAFVTVEWPPHDAHLGIRWDVHHIVLVAKAGEQPVGVARGLAVGGVGELKHLLVTRERVGGGIGSRLLAEFEKRCRALGCHKLRLETADYQARPFYEKHGFAVAAELDDDRFGRVWFIMEKRLA